MIQSKLNGRMGNQMFQYCVARLIAEKNKYNFFIPGINHPDLSPSTEGHHLKIFFPEIDLGTEDGKLLYKYAEDHTIQSYNPNIFSIPDYTHLYGFFQTEKYFLENEDKVKSWFKIDKDEIVKSMLNRFNIDEYCYIHMRISDYKTHNHWLLPKKYYINAMNKVREIFTDVIFIIITDDLISSKEMFPEIECISNHMMVDFKLLYYSKYCIISNSTFAWWPAWLSNKDVTIAPNNWLNYNKPELGFYPVDMKTKNFIYI